jgi:hypothetical protein
MAIFELQKALVPFGLVDQNFTDRIGIAWMEDRDYVSGAVEHIPKTTRQFFVAGLQLDNNE